MNLIELITFSLYLFDSGKRGTKPDNKIKLHVEYHKNNNKTTVPDMIDGLTAETDTDETNR